MSILRSIAKLLNWSFDKTDEPHNSLSGGSHKFNIEAASQAIAIPYATNPSTIRLGSNTFKPVEKKHA